MIKIKIIFREKNTRVFTVSLSHIIRQVHLFYDNCKEDIIFSKQYLIDKLMDVENNIGTTFNPSHLYFDFF